MLTNIFEIMIILLSLVLLSVDIIIIWRQKRAVISVSDACEERDKYVRFLISQYELIAESESRLDKENQMLREEVERLKSEKEKRNGR